MTLFPVNYFRIGPEQSKIHPPTDWFRTRATTPHTWVLRIATIIRWVCFPLGIGVSLFLYTNKLRKGEKKDVGYSTDWDSCFAGGCQEDCELFPYILYLLYFLCDALVSSNFLGGTQFIPARIITSGREGQRTEQTVANRQIKRAKNSFPQRHQLRSQNFLYLTEENTQPQLNIKNKS